MLKKLSSPILFALSLLVSAVLGSACGTSSTAAPKVLPRDPGERAVASRQLNDFPLHLDVFRQSAALPPLGVFREEYTEVLLPRSSLPEGERRVLAEKIFNRLAMMEFALLSREGKPIRATLISAGAAAPDGDFELSALSRSTQLEAEDGPSVPVSIPFPFLSTGTSPDQPMTWGLWIHGGSFVHSTSHYAELGTPSGTGGILQSYPDAMELYTLAQESRTVVRIHAAGISVDDPRVGTLAEVRWILPRLQESSRHISEVIRILGPEVKTLGHGWMNPVTGKLSPPAWPKCGVFNCFNAWNVRVPGESERE
jgi:hypothetical protein